MERRLRTNLLLAAVVAALGAFIWLAPEPKPGAEMYALFDASGAVTRIEVCENGNVHLALQFDGEKWNLTAPYDLPADAFQVNALLDSLHQGIARRYPVGELDLAALGLEQPRWSMHVDGEEVLVGDRTALGNDRYLLKSGFVYLASDVLTYRVQRDPLDYASRRVLPPGSEIVSIALPSAKRITRSGVTWTLDPDDSAVTSDALQSLVDAWRNATAVNVMGAHSVPRDGDVLISFADGSALRFGVEAREAELLLTRGDSAVTYVLPAVAAEGLLQLSRNTENRE